MLDQKYAKTECMQMTSPGEVIINRDRSMLVSRHMYFKNVLIPI